MAYFGNNNNRNSRTNALIAQEQLNQNDGQTANKPSPEGIAQERASLDYFRLLNDILDIKIRILEKKIKLHNLPAFIRIWQDPKTGQFLKEEEQYIITSNKKIFDENKNNNKLKIRYVGKDGVVEAIKLDIKSEEELIEAVKNDYEKAKDEYKGYEPENLTIIRAKYNLDEPFPPNFETDYFNEDKSSSWSMYQENKRELEKLETRLKNLKDPTTRKKELGRIEDETYIRGNVHYNDKDFFKRAVEVVIDANKASTSLLQRRLVIGYGQASHLIEVMEANGVIGPANGSTPRKVLISSIDQIDRAIKNLSS